MTIERSLIKKMNFFALCLVVMGLPFSIQITSISLVIFFITYLTRIATDRPSLLFSEKRSTLVFASLFIIYLGVVVISGFRNAFVLEKKIVLLLMPIFFGLKTDFDQLKIDTLLSLFVGFTLLAALIPFNNQWHLLIHPDISIQGALPMDRPYFALYFFFGVAIVVYMAVKSNSSIIKASCIIVGLIFMYLAYAIFAKMAFVSFSLATIICLGAFCVQKKKYLKLSVVFFCLLIVLLTVILSNEDLRLFTSKLIKLQPFDMTEGRWVYFLSINTRYVIWDCSIKLLTDSHNWVLGCGLDYQSILDGCYSQNWEKYGIRTSDGIDPLFLESHLNPHNEFLQTWIETGVVGLIALLSNVGYAIWIGLRRENYLYVFFTLFFFICCLTESMLTRQKGIVFYALFNSLFAFQMSNEPKEALI